ncbi:MAG: hypothetical protein J6S40_02740 [Thermoguttaceae bacterium]|nr:hypothetical protein [Thermoguttaceae bacterium]
MPLDSHSPCPCGSGKEIRFCCSDMLKDYQQLETMLSGGQFAAALSMIEKLEKDHPNNAALISAKCLILRETGRFDEFIAQAESFYRGNPDKLKAIAEYVIARTIGGQTDEALSVLVDGIEKNEPGKIDGSLLFPLIMIAQQLLEQGNIYTAVALAKLSQSFNPKGRESAALLAQIYRRKDIPLIEKELTFDPAAPDDFPFRDKYQDAAVRLATGHWKEGRAILEELLSCAGQWPNLYRSLGLVNFWLGDTDAAAEAMRKFASSAKVSFDDAVDALTAAMLTRRQLSDDLDVMQVIRTIPNPDKALEILLSTPRLVSMPFDARMYGDAERPAPSHAFRVVDRPFPPQGEALTLENTPLLLGTFLFFGKQTDRDARIEIQVFEQNRETLLAFLSEALGAELGPEVETNLLTKLPWLFKKLDPEFQIKDSAAFPAESVKKLYRDYFETAFAEEWLNHPSDFLDGKTPLAYAGQPESAPVLSALVQTVAFQTDPQFSEGLARALREKLGIPQPETLTPPEGDDSAVLAFFQRIPIWRWCRADVSTLSVTAAGQLLRVVSIFGEDEAMTRLSDRILSVPADEADSAKTASASESETASAPDRRPLSAAEARYMAYEVRIAKAETAEGPAKALELIAEAKRVAREAGISDASLSLREAAMQLALGRIDEFRRLVSYVAREHRGDPEAMAELQMMMINLGLINPDGTPRTVSNAPAAAEPVSPAAEPKLWTPDSDAPSSGGSKLWTPD